jgi:hypothetical protein
MQLSLHFKPYTPSNQLSLKFDLDWEFCLPEIRAELVSKLQNQEKQQRVSDFKHPDSLRRPLTAKQATEFAKKFMKEIDIND